MIAFAGMLLAASTAAWIAAAAAPLRIYVRIAAGLYAALAIAVVVDDGLAGPVALAAMASAPAMLALAASRAPLWVAAPIWSAACIAGFAAAAFGLAPLAFTSLLASAAAIAIARHRMPLALAASVALVAGATSFAAGGAEALPALLAFSSAALIGLALDCAVVKPRRRGRGGAVRAAR